MSGKPKPTLKSSVGSQRLQPIRATKPFQLRQGSPARKSPSSSPTPMLPRPATDPRRNKWPDHRSSPDRADRKSPSSPGIKMTNRRSPSPRVCRTSHDPALTGSYLTGQWPRDITANTFYPLSNSGTSTKSTQTPVDWNSESLNSQTKSNKGLSNRTTGYQDHVDYKQMKQQMRRHAKSSRQEKRERQSPVHANHAALPQSQAAQQRSSPMPIYGRGPRRQNSWEGLNKEIENITIRDSNDAPRFSALGITPPDGHRAPLPRSATRSMETQTPQGFARDSTPANNESHSPSPSHDQCLHIGKMGETGHSPYPKYASSPRPNKSYMFKREPPEGAESVKPFKEQDMQIPIGPSCPDKQKINFQISQNGSFKKWSRQICNEQDKLSPLIPTLTIKCDGDGSSEPGFRVATGGSYLESP